MDTDRHAHGEDMAVGGNTSRKADGFVYQSIKIKEGSESNRKKSVVAQWLQYFFIYINYFYKEKREKEKK